MKTELEIEALRAHLGNGKIQVHGNVIAIRERLSVQRLQSNLFELLASPAALAALAKHASDDTERWFERGLKDPATCVRMEVARLLPTLDRIVHQELFDLARHDPNPVVKRLAKKRH